MMYYLKVNIKIVLIGFVCMCSVKVEATTYYVNTAGDDLQSGLSWANAFGTIQKALLVAQSGDEIWVEQGEYYPNEGPFPLTFESIVMKPGVKLYGSFKGNEIPGFDLTLRDFDSDPSIISGEIQQDGVVSNNTKHVILNDGNNLDSTSIMDGFVIVGGYAPTGEAYPNNTGGGMLNKNSSPKIENCSFINNYADYGAGMSNYVSAPIVINTLFANNNSTNDGGGMYNDTSSTEIRGCIFEQNVGVNGGGVYDRRGANTKITGGQFFLNMANGGNGGGLYIEASTIKIEGITFTLNESDFDGGAIHSDGSNIIIEDCSFLENRARKGGAIYDEIAQMTVDSSSFHNNEADEHGGAIYSNNFSTINNCSFIQNKTIMHGGAIYFWIAGASVHNSTFQENEANEGGGIFTESSEVTIENCLLYGNQATTNGGAIRGSNTTTILNFSTITENTSGLFCTDIVPLFSTAIENSILWENNIELAGTAHFDVRNSIITGGFSGAGYNYYDVDPLFIDANNANFQLDACSPAIDIADSDAPPNDDLLGNARPINAKEDIGCYEFQGVVPAFDLPCSDATVQLDENGEGFLHVSQFEQGVSSACGPVDLELCIGGNCDTIIELNCFNITFFNNVRLQGTDAIGRYRECLFNLTIVDDIAPILNCPNDTIVSTEPEECSAVVGYDIPAGTDVCGVDIGQIAGLGSGALFFPGTTTQTFMVTDIAGNTSTCSFNVIVQDTEPPTFDCPDDIVVSNIPGECSQVLNLSPPASDNCVVDTYVQLQGVENGGIFLVGPAITQQYRVTDGSGNTADCVFTVTVNDTEPPTIDCPDNIVVDNIPGECSQILNFSAPASDNCVVDTYVQLQGVENGGIFLVGPPITQHYRVTDGVGNTTDCIFTITVNDTELPTIDCPDDIVVSNIPGECSAIVNFSVPASDNCVVDFTTQMQGIESGGIFPVGSTQQTFRVTDGVGNTADCSFTITVNDVEQPTFNCPDDFLLQTDPGACSAVLLAVVPAFDNCVLNSYILLEGLPNGGAYPIGSTTQTYQITDGSGNTATCSYVVEVVSSAKMVTNTLDAGIGSLRNAISDACPADTIIFDISMIGDTIALSGPEIVIDTPVKIFGLGQNDLFISAQDNSRVFHVLPNIPIEINELSLIKGHPTDGLILNQGELNIENVSLFKN